MSKLPQIKTARVLRALKRLGFRLDRQKGSHAQLIRGNRLVTVPIHAGDLNPEVLRSILRQAGVEQDEFLAAM